MKKLVLTLLLAAATVSSYAQGTVYFANGGITFATATDQSRVVYVNSTAPGNELVGTQFRAQLYYGVNAASLIAVATTGNAFRAPGTATPGTWASPGFRTLVGFTEGNTVTLQVRAWDSTGGFATWESALNKGQSTTWTYTVPAPGSPAGAFYLEGLRSFAVVPEPGTFALAGLGLLGLVMARRRK